MSQLSRSRSRSPRVPRPCLTCGTPTHRTPAYCDAHWLEKQRARTPRHRPHYDGEWKKISKEIRKAWLEEYGPLCPGHARSPHWVRAADLTVDHVVARDASLLAVLCRSCNASKGTKTAS